MKTKQKVSMKLLQEAKDTVPLATLIWPELKEQGAALIVGNITGTCPFCYEDAFVVSTKRGLYHCWECKGGGDQLTYVMRKYDCGIEDALKYLLPKYHLEVLEQ